ncbi:MAG: hypothetical protein H7Z14_20345 [Anaerolineae bacterium]|nr:hypothetical protein [Phycisphaerae bacterium]
MLLRPPRAWCLAVRAADTRINPFTACIAPEDAAYPRSHLTGDALRDHRCARHEVTLDTTLLKKLCEPVAIDPPGEPHDVVAQKLGVHPTALITARINGVLRAHHVRNLGGRRGRIPILYTDQPLDPCSRTFAPPDPLWGWTAHHLAYGLPSDFEQTLERVPAYRPLMSDRAYHDHPEAAEPPDAPKYDRRLPRPPPDYVWYKWKNGVYVGTEWDRKAEARREKYRERKAKGEIKSRAGNAKGSLKFDGWHWICPSCKRESHTLYCPLPPINLELANHRDVGGLSEVDQLQPANQCFACWRCHRVRAISFTERSGWNAFITYLSGGLLFGGEVPKLAALIDAQRAGTLRKRAYVPQSNRKAPRRQQVLNRLMNGWSIRRIARDMSISICAVLNHVHALCVQYEVPDRHTLAKQFGSKHAQPLTQDERAEARYAEVERLLLLGRTYRQIMKDLQTDWSSVNHDACLIYKRHGVSGRRALAKKIGVITPIEELRAKIRERLARGEGYPQIMRELGVSRNQVHHHAKVIYRREKVNRREGLMRLKSDHGALGDSVASDAAK